uniref:Putative reverse transcriptase, intron maturase and HNH endonuclease n=1 Tax=Bracteacoccus giganteus TaxID=50039 RepID=A0A0S2LQA0_9CHLO|nr:putative reverse transcriptase, intron maturase and HNH endonuclease [Bracteacoccus giganteus]ALO63556.1 putative reverse transcriptase, intron maturase and HNH endonuclease [Bracteacoccus giganteus]
MSITINTWNDIDWGETRSNVRKIQYRIYKSRLQGDLKKVHWLQNYLINHFGAKLLAVRQVTTLNKGKSTAGIDRISTLTPQQKLTLATELQIDGKTVPIRRVWIPKPGKTEKRPLGIPTIKDRAKQALTKLALEPEWEAVFEPNSYGFRPGRSAHDAIEAIYQGLHFDTPKWVYDADIRKCFDMISHDALLEKLETFPLMKTQIAAWLKSGVMEGYANTTKEVLGSTAGTPQGGVISPLLANIAMHGLENHLKDFVAKLPIKPHPGSNRGETAKRKALTVVRYADDFVLIHRNKQILELCIERVKEWLAKMDLSISEEKSRLRDIRGGFLFLGFQIIQVKRLKKQTYKVKIQPSVKSQQKLLTKISDLLRRNKAASAYQVVTMLRPVIIGWANYFKYCECKNVFSKLTNLIFQKLRAWVFRRDTRSGRLKIKQKYFPSGRTYQFAGRTHEDEWVLVGRSKSKGGEVSERYLPHIVWVPSCKHVKVQGTQSPYNLEQGLYWALRSARYSPYPLRVRTLLIRQEQRCPWCDRQFTIFDASNWEVDHILPRSTGGQDMYDNLQLLHKDCHIAKSRVDGSRNS